MINSKEILYSKGNNDECMTPNYGVKPIVKYIPKEATVWCPFDKENSEFVKQIREAGHKVIATHIDNGQDFYTYEPDENWDCIVSNPPFTNKRKIFERALSLANHLRLLHLILGGMMQLHIICLKIKNYKYYLLTRE